MYERSIQFRVDSELENKESLEKLMRKKKQLLQKKITLKNKLNILGKRLENNKKRFKTEEEFRIKKQNENIEFLKFNSGFLEMMLKNMQETGNPIEFKEKLWRKR